MLVGWWWLRPTRADIQVIDGVSYFHGKRCTKDCGGHKAGYECAMDHGIDDDRQCGGKSASFREGCLLYVQE